MLQQTQVTTVIPYYRRWLERFPDFVSARAGAGSGGFARLAGTRLLRARPESPRGRQIRCRKLRRQTCLPRPLKIAELPGVGRYTAGAIASFAFDRAEPIVEANIGRVLARLTNLQIPIDMTAGRAHLWQTATALLPASNARVHNSALMDLGALLCLPRRPRCGECPVRRFCRAEQPALLPRKKKRPTIIQLTESHIFAQRRSRVLLEQSDERWRGMWILPRLSRTPQKTPLLEMQFPFTRHRITLAVFAGPDAVVPNEKQRWFSRRALERLPLPSPHRRALAFLLSDEQRLHRLKN